MSVQVFCCPHAGAGASVFRSWSPPEGSGLSIHPVQLAGREQLFHLDPHQRMADAADHVFSTIAATAQPGGQIALFGHSFGAALAFEAALRVVADGRFTLVRLIASGAPAPVVALPLGLRGLDDAEFVARLEDVVGYTHPALAIPELRDIILPPLRADMVMREDYCAATDAVLPVPVTAVRGDADPIVDAEASLRWGEVTSAGCDLVELPGGHMYFAVDPAPLLEVMTGVLSDPAETVTSA